ncbi:hypothetical protein SDC9_99375 [bioreactor metagenome]|uniref:Uncharacterized protein n=1 Tax=bioreactor metagenome TaxID=1076179 RepID=A0A645AHE3_9ZZZZ
MLKENIGFYIEKETYLKFLEDNNYACFWTILSEKRIIGGSMTSQNDFNNIIKSGVIYLDKHNNLVENTSIYVNE